MTDVVVARAHRILKPLTQYRSILGDLSNTPEYVKDVLLKENEILIGVYENFPHGHDESIVITNFGLHYYIDKQWEFIPYNIITESKIQSPIKENVEEISLTLVSGKLVWLPVRGGQGRFRDAFEFLRFLMRVTEDIRSNP
jgi:hypothetical protein